MIVGIMGLERLAVEASCSASLIQKLVSESYLNVPSLRTIDGICKASGYQIDEIFPFFEDKKESA